MQAILDMLSGVLNYHNIKLIVFINFSNKFTSFPIAHVSSQIMICS